jgi:hypothetical protein
MRYFSGVAFDGREVMTRTEATVLASRTLATLLVVWALSDISYVPQSVHTLLHYLGSASTSSEDTRHYYLLVLGFHGIRIVGYSLVARWLFKVGPEVEEFLLPTRLRETPDAN